MNINQLETLYNDLKTIEDPFDIIFDFKSELLSSDDVDYLEFHYKAIQDQTLPDKVRGYIKSFFFSEAANKRDKKVVEEFLYQKYVNGIEDIDLKADVIQLLGNLRSKHARKVALENITIRKGKLRYRSIIVLGWVGA
jgi:hypothetical protein